jgi:hypothetical protein
MLKIRDVIEPMLRLLEDVKEAETLLEEKDTQFFRRAYIRSTFTSIEGIIWLIKQVCFNAKPLDGPRVISVADYILLSEVSYDLKHNGEPSVQTKYLQLANNLRFTAKVVQRLFHATLDLGVGTTKWEKFRKAIAIRNRITHPKNIEEMTITDDEISLCKDVQHWFNELTYAFMQGVLTTSITATKQTKTDS